MAIFAGVSSDLGYKMGFEDSYLAHGVMSGF